MKDLERDGVDGMDGIDGRLEGEPEALAGAPVERDLLALLVERSHDFIGISDPQLRPVYVNQAGLRLVGLDSLKEVQRVPVLEFFFPEDQGFIEDRFFPQVLRDGYGEAEVRFRHFRTGEAIWMIYSVLSLRDSRGEPTGFATISRNITAQKRVEQLLRQSEAHFRAMADGAPAILWVTDPEGSCTYLSRQWYEYTGGVPGQDLGLGWLEKTHPDDLEATRRIFLDANERRMPFRLDYRLRRHDGEYRWAVDAGQPRFDEQGAYLGFVGSVIDVHERIVLEQTLREANRSKDEFLATLAHELRNPLAPMRNALQLLRLAGDDPAVAERSRTLLERQMAQMVRLIDDLLDISRITTGKLELRREPADLAAIVQSAVETSRPLLEARNHRLTVQLPPGPVLLEADATRLAQALANLLNNAAKYTSPGGHIELRAAREDGGVAVRVKDDGAGIPAEMLPRIFEMFLQLDSSLERSQGGLGIGLTLTRRLVEMHGGTIEAFSEGADRGTEVRIWLPAIGEEEQAAGPRAREEPAGAPARRILIADDNQDAAETLGMMLEILGNEVHIAHDGLEAVHKASELRPEVVLLDIGMPRLNGYDAARRIREQPWGHNALLIALTGWGQDEDKRLSREAGFDHHLVKPVEPAMLTELLSRVGVRAE